MGAFVRVLASWTGLVSVINSLFSLPVPREVFARMESASTSLLRACLPPAGLQAVHTRGEWRGRRNPDSIEAAFHVFCIGTYERSYVDNDAIAPVTNSQTTHHTNDASDLR